jgi:hypothetical protein
VKTVLQVAAVFALIAFPSTPPVVEALVYVAVAATVISGADYFFGLRRRGEPASRTELAVGPGGRGDGATDPQAAVRRMNQFGVSSTSASSTTSKPNRS